MCGIIFGIIFGTVLLIIHLFCCLIATLLGVYAWLVITDKRLQ